MINNAGSDENATIALVVPIVKIEEIINQKISTIEGIAKNEYQFIKNCEEFFAYDEPQKVVLNETGDCSNIISIKKSIQNFLNKPEGESIEKQTDLSIFETNSSLLFSTFAFQQSICLSKLSKKEMHSLICRRVSCHLLK